MGYYDKAQICKSGHVITTHANLSPESTKKYCPTCGETTLINCEFCNSPIQGAHHVPGVITVGGKYTIPKYCYNCGKSYPWTELKLRAAKQMVDLFENLTPDEKTILKSNLDDLVKDTPSSEKSAYTFKKLMLKAGKEAAGAMRDLIVDIMSEAVKKALWP